MNSDTMIELCKKHTLYTWSATGSVAPMPIERAEGVYMYGPEGQKWLDFNSQLMSVNIGHNHPKVVKAIQEQAAKLTYVWPGTATEPRALLGKRLAELVPGNINTFFFCLSGAEANENAIKAARAYTGRFKILSRYRSYHGATNATMQLTGDPRRLPNEPGAPGFIKVLDPTPYDYSFGKTEAEITENNLRYLDEVIQYEGPDQIAAMFIETVTGTNGVLPPPAGYLKGLRALLDKYGILLVCDEVMAGFGRTGKFLAFEHGDIVPDIVCMAKGLTSSYLPLGAMGLSDPIAEHFRHNVFWGGLTYNSHALCTATALAAIDALIEDGLIDNAVAMGAVMRKHMEQLQADHPSVKGFRQIGLFGMVDTHLWKYNHTHPAVGEFAAFLKDNGLFTFVRWGSFMCNPPLCINEEQIAEAFDIFDRGLPILDRAWAAEQAKQG
jgi:taurine--2-oxoglutarate transaminase